MAIRCKQIQYLKAGNTVIKDIDKAIVLRESIIITESQFEKFNARSKDIQYVKIKEEPKMVKLPKTPKKPKEVELQNEGETPTEQLEPTE